jgi:hypothetical protein
MERDRIASLFLYQRLDGFSYTRTNQTNRWRLVKLNRPLAIKLAKSDDSRYG